MPKQESSIKNQSKARSAPKTASTATSSSATGNKAKPAAPGTKAASTGGVRRNGGNIAERVRQRAYEIWEREGRPEGREQEHWEQAEREIAKVRGAREAAAGR
jgi:hypothetical protein